MFPLFVSFVRLNVLSTVVRKPMEQILNECNGTMHQDEDDSSGSGDVKYHLGASYVSETAEGKKVRRLRLALHCIAYADAMRNA